MSKRFWVIEYVNSQAFIGRFNNHWTLGDLETAALFDSEAEASQARQALLTEGHDRLANHKQADPSRFWWNICGGLVVVSEVRITRAIVPTVSETIRTAPEPQA